MPVNSLHPHFDALKDAVFDCRTAFEGGRAIKAMGNRYLPQLKDQPNDEYNAYKNRALFFSITAKTVSALVGMVMARNPIVKASEAMAPYFTERQGAQFLEIASTTVQEVLLMGGYGILIDAPQDGALLPSLVRYPRETIINWRVDGSGRPTLVVLKEHVVVQKADDIYALEEVCYYRRLMMNGGVYQIDVLNDKGEAQIPTIFPTVRGRNMDHIPFYLINPLGVSMDMMRPPMLDIVDLNISHYRTSADLEHGRHFTGLPTPVISGIEGGTELYIGSQKAWVLPNPDAKASYLEFTGQGLQSLEKALQEKQGQMASMSARLIDNSKRGSEAAETVKLRYMSETAGLITTTRSVEDGLNQVYGEVADIVGEPRPIVQLNKEFMDGRLSAGDLTALVKAYLEGALSKDTLVYNLRKGDIISPKQEDNAEKEEILDPGELERRAEEEKAAAAAAGKDPLNPANKLPSAQPQDPAAPSPPLAPAPAAPTEPVQIHLTVEAPIINMGAISVESPDIQVDVAPAQISVPENPVVVNMGDVNVTAEVKPESSKPAVSKTFTANTMPDGKMVVTVKENGNE